MFGIDSRTKIIYQVAGNCNLNEHDTGLMEIVRIAFYRHKLYLKVEDMLNDDEELKYCTDSVPDSKTSQNV